MVKTRSMRGGGSRFGAIPDRRSRGAPHLRKVRAAAVETKRWRKFLSDLATKMNNGAGLSKNLLSTAAAHSAGTAVSTAGLLGGAWKGSKEFVDNICAAFKAAAAGPPGPVKGAARAPAGAAVGPLGPVQGAAVGPLGLVQGAAGAPAGAAVGPPGPVQGAAGAPVGAAVGPPGPARNAIPVPVSQQSRTNQVSPVVVNNNVGCHASGQNCRCEKSPPKEVHMNPTGFLASPAVRESLGFMSSLLTTQLMKDDIFLIMLHSVYHYFFTYDVHDKCRNWKGPLKMILTAAYAYSSGRTRSRQ